MSEERTQEGAYVIRKVREAIEAAVHPRGMSVHDGQAKVDASHLAALLAIVERQEAEIARLTAFQSSMRCPNCDAVRLQFMEAEADAKEQARLVGMGAERELSAIQRAERAEHAVAALKAENDELDRYCRALNGAEAEARQLKAKLVEWMNIAADVREQLTQEQDEARQLREQLDTIIPQVAWAGATSPGEAIYKLCKKQEELREQLAACERDAARYRWLRERRVRGKNAVGIYCVEWESRSYGGILNGDELDAAIDRAAMSAKEDK